jgi:TetR/AcrR family transcriptional regulator, transcriptional repressor for nem operon
VTRRGTQLSRPTPAKQTPPAPTRERLIETAARLFHEQGYHATGVATILHEAGVNSGSLYHHFASKEDLLKSVLERYRVRIGPVLIGPVEAAEPIPIERIFRLLDAYRNNLEVRGYGMGCPIGNLALEVGDDLPDARLLINANFIGWQAAVAEWLRQAGASPSTAADMALFTLTTMEGAIMLSRTRHSLEPFDSAVRMLRDYFGRLVQDPGYGE